VRLNNSRCGCGPDLIPVSWPFRYNENLSGLFASHNAVNHSLGEYARGFIHTNTVEGFFSIFKRGMRGVYQHCREKHLHRYLAEFDFRYTFRAATGYDDAARTAEALKGARGKRLMYRQPDYATV
jgi:hypothetical protein